MAIPLRKLTLPIKNTTTGTVTNTEYTVVTPEEMEQKANIDGNYAEMTVGTAEQLISSSYVTEKAPYIFRTSGGSADIGNREEDTIVGGSIAWNQLATGVRDASTVNGVTFAITSAFVGTMTGTTSSNGAFKISKNNDINFISGHKYLISWGTKFPNGFSIRLGDTVADSISANNRTAGIVQCSATTSGSINLYMTANTELSLTYKLAVFDLTAMFGSAVADAVYAMEQANAGSGVAWFKAQYPLDYYEYDAGTLKSVEGLQSHDMVGFNQWDEEWEFGYIDATTGQQTTATQSIRSKNFNKCVPNTNYYGKFNAASGQVLYLYWYDTDENFIARTNATNAVSTSPSNASYFKIACYLYNNTYRNDICINLSWSGTRNGEYEPYVKHSYPLDSTLTLRGIPKWGTDGMYYDGDTYEADGTVTRKYGIVDLGTLNWIYNSDRAIFYSNGLVNIIKRTSYTALGNLVCPKYLTVIASGNNGGVDKTISVGTLITTDGINIKDSAYTDATAFKTAMSGVMLVYELATPTTEQAQPYTNPQIVDDFGTEEYVTTGLVAVGHETKYLQNLRDKLQHLPNLADSDGAYMIQQTGTQMALTSYKIPAPPSADGTYVLKVTVSGGTPTFTYVEEQ